MPLDRVETHESAAFGGWKARAEAAEARVVELEAALRQISELPGVEFVGTGKERVGILNAHRKATDIAEDALKGKDADV